MIHHSMKRLGSFFVLGGVLTALLVGSAQAENKVLGDLKRKVQKNSSSSKVTKKGATNAAKVKDDTDGTGTGKPTTLIPPAATTSGPDAAVFTVDINGTKEQIVIKFDETAAPKTVENFRKNIESGFYNGLAFHRVIRNYLIQAGDPLTKDEAQRDNWGTSDNGATVPGEFNGSHKRYAVAMAHKPSETTSSGSQFYIMLRDDTNLDKKYAVFGTVVAGMDVLNRISGVVVDTNDVPARRLEISDTKLVDSASTVAAANEKGRRKTIPASQKGMVDKFMERFW